MSSSQNRIKHAVEAFAVKERKKYQRNSGRKNKKPEEKVVDDHLAFFPKNDWFVNRYESKAVRHASGGWRQTSVVVGHPDLLGVTPRGQIAALELKAPGKRSTVRSAQHDFLHAVIIRGGLGLVSDSLSYTLRVYHEWLPLPHDARVAFLLKELPAQKLKVGVCPF